ncbi:MAG: hypothetical protein IT280_13320, partial [Ignavibacteria bacterium]|nr:hypothetical protein [Ignavibacteria bacterium]MCC6867130.1 hypothetical protein [Ignavibacteria bacterium]
FSERYIEEPVNKVTPVTPVKTTEVVTNGPSVSPSQTISGGPLGVQMTGAATIKNISVSEEVEKIRQAKQKGYTGDICQSCGSLTMVRNGTCLKCVTCGETSGCS